MRTSLPKRVAALLVAAFLLSGAGGGLATTANQGGAAKSGVDLVILLDNSNSMRGGRDNKNVSDYDGYRFDAAAIMLNMVPLYASRAAVVPFHFRNVPISIPGQEKDQLLNIAELNQQDGKDLAGSSNRAVFTSKLSDFVHTADHGTQGGTMIGTALEEAVRLLNAGAADRDGPGGNGNKPMILLLADGRIAASGTADKKDVPDIERGELDKANKAAADSRQNGYTIYTVLLNSRADNKDVDTQVKSNMFNWADATGGLSLEINEPSDLPKVFSAMFGHQIGSEMVSTQPVATYEADKGYYQIEIDIPNKSVEEANILLQTEGLENIRLMMPGDDDRVAIADVYKIEMSRFVQYKIHKPRERGTWRLVFGKVENAPEHVAVNVLYNYTETLAVQLEPAAGPYKKGDRVTLTAQLWKDGQPSRDALLYEQQRDADGQVVKGIQAWAYLMAGNYSGTALDTEAAISKIELPPHATGRDRFEAAFSISDFLDVNHNPIRKEGQYQLFVRLSGSGLLRVSDSISFPVENQAPQVALASIPAIQMEIDDPNDPEYGKPQERPLRLSDYVIDRDGDALTPSVLSSDPGIVLIADPGEDAGMPTTVTTQGKPGTASLFIQVKDNDGAALADAAGAPLPADGLEIPVEVVSIAGELEKSYAPVISLVTQPNDEGYFNKDSIVNFSVRIEGSASGYDITRYNPHIRAFHVKGDRMSGADVELGLTKADSTTWTGALQLDDREQYVIRAELWAGNQADQGGGIKLGSAQFDDISSGNAAPTVRQEAAGRLLRTSAEVEPFTLLKQEATEPWTITLNDLFDDKNLPHDALSIGLAGAQDAVGVEMTEEAEAPGDAFPEGRTLYKATFTPKAAGKAAFTITATDKSDTSASLPYEIEVISLTQAVKEKAMLYGAILLGAVILLLIVLRILKPSFKGMKLLRKRDASVHTESILPDTKSRLSLSQYADGTMLADVGLNKTHLQNVKLQAAKNSIFVLYGKGGHGPAIIKVGNQTLSKKNKKLKLQVGRELKVENNGHSISWVLQVNQAPRPRKGPPAPRRRGPYAGS